MKKKWIIKESDIPNDKVIHSYFFEKTDLLDQVKKFKACDQSSYLKLNLKTNHTALQESVLGAIKQFGIFPFSYNGHTTEDGIYMSASLTWNENAIDRTSDNPHTATLGSSIFQYGSATLYGENYEGRNTYKDTLSFRSLTPFSQFGEIKKLTDSFKCTLVRSRVSVLMANRLESTRFNFGWHNDEEIFVNMRVNIPIISNENYFIQIVDRDDICKDSIIEFNLDSGYAYVYDTNKNHRPYTKKINQDDRINMVYGVSPWFNYIEDEKIWVSNDYYGEVHPFEMIKKGLISDLIN